MNLANFGMDTVTLGGSLATKLAASRAAGFAQIKLWAGTAAEATLSSATNTFADVLSGVSITVSEVPK